MKILLFSDTHDRLDKFDKIFQILKEIKPDHVFFLGDLVSPFAAGRLNSIFENLKITCKGVWGNNEGDVLTILRKINPQRFTLEKQPVITKIDDLTIVLLHGIKTKDITLTMIDGYLLTETANIILFGHTHEPCFKEYDRNQKNIKTLNVLAELKKSEEFRIQTDLEKYAIAINPGEVCGWLTGISSLALLEIQDKKATVIFKRI